jgi:hypothetical protein
MVVIEYAQGATVKVEVLSLTKRAINHEDTEYSLGEDDNDGSLDEEFHTNTEILNFDASVI